MLTYNDTLNNVLVVPTYSEINTVCKFDFEVEFQMITHYSLSGGGIYDQYTIDFYKNSNSIL